MANDWEALAGVASTMLGGPDNTWTREADILRRVFEGCPEDCAGTFRVTIREIAGDANWVVNYPATSALEYYDAYLSAVISELLSKDPPPEMAAKCMAVLDILRSEYLGFGVLDWERKMSTAWGTLRLLCSNYSLFGIDPAVWVAECTALESVFMDSSLEQRVEVTLITYKRGNVVLPESWRICVACNCGVYFGVDISRPFLVSVIRRLLEMHTCSMSDDIRAALFHVSMLLDAPKRT